MQTRATAKAINPQKYLGGPVIKLYEVTKAYLPRITAVDANPEMKEVPYYSAISYL